MTTSLDSIIQTADILVVDDALESLRLLTEILTRAGYRVRPADGPHVALESALAHPPSLILLDVRMPEMNGFELCRRLRQEERTADIPIIFVSALQAVEDRVQGFKAGGVDFVSKPFEESEVLARVKAQLQLRTTQLHLEALVAERTAELVQVNQALRISKEHYRSVVQDTPGMLCTFKPIGEIIFANRAYCDYFDKSLEELVGSSFLAQIPEEDRELVATNIAALTPDAPVQSQEHRVIAPNGQTRWQRWTNRALFDEDSSAVVCQAFGEDITESKRIEEALRKSNRRLEEAQRTARIGDWEYDLLAGRTTWSRELYRIFDVDPQVYVPSAKSDELFCHPDDAPALREAFERFFATGEEFDLDYRIVTPKGKVRTCRRRGRLIVDDRGIPVLAIGTTEDITERKLAERKILEYQRRLQLLASQLTLSEERERRRVALELHDDVGQKLAFVRTGLVSARKATSVARRDAILDDVSQALRQAIRDIRDLVFDLSSPLMNELGLAAALEEWLEEQVGKKHGIQTEFTHDGQQLKLDYDMRAILFRSVRELLANVVRHARARQVSVRLEGKGTIVRIVVKDDGVGFDVAAIQEAVRRGGGFGLFSIQERMADLGGSLEVSSEQGQGCTATLTAPTRI
jgi:PAS domain S-box-containing protein